MPKKLMWKWITIFALLILSAWLLYPTYNWYSMPQTERTRLEAERSRPKRILNLGLDLRGGSYLLLELDVSKLDKTEKTQDALQRAIEILRNRIDQYGVAETPIARQGERWISVQLPGIANTDTAEELIGKTAMLEFKTVDTSPAAEKVLSMISEADEPFLQDGSLNPVIAKELPAGAEVLKGKEAKYYVVESSVIVTGAYLKDAKVQTGGQYGYPYISFTFDKDGGKLFSEYTGSHIGKYLAIVLDGVVHSAPVIKSRISGGSGIIEGNFSIEEAKNLAIILRAGALPAPVRIIEKRTVGPGVGEDSIKAGLNACLLGFILIVLFMIVYYRTSGFIADIALSLNFVFLIATMAYFSATLTLPGIAGMILSLAMAVDANVLILERIREEIHAGKPLVMCIPLGYDKAWSAILDSNLTTWIAAVFLFQFGSGPVKGFAVTLTLGLLIGVFTSVFVSRAIYELWLNSNPKELSI
ncbi:MAG: protein translocase subunit SecD [Elusimicrobiaceae bacterium]|nr:protein translocase subunit SecD [Elusimicrobiaceae bacterium]